MIDERIIRTIAFVGRCSGAATVANIAATWVGLPHSVWAAMSALVVSQERLSETRSSLRSRIIGTLIGIVVAVAVNVLTSPRGVGVAGQIALSVGICALVAHEFPKFRVCMWTGPIVLLTADPSISTPIVGVYRGSEVILGALIGGAFHYIAEALVTLRIAAGHQTNFDRASRRESGAE